MMDALTEKIVSAIQEIVAAAGPQGITSRNVWEGLQTESILVSWETTSRWLRTMHDAHQIEMRHNRWVTGSPEILSWDKPPLAVSREQWASYQADGAPPGTYQPNMSPAWMARWKAKMCGQRSAGLEDLRVEIRKSTGNSVQILVVAFADGRIRLSMNGTGEMTAAEFAELPLAVVEAREAMTAYARDHRPAAATA